MHTNRIVRIATDIPMSKLLCYVPVQSVITKKKKLNHDLCITIKY